MVKKNDKSAQRFSKLKQLLTGHSNMLIVLQDNPDPDAIAAALGLRKLANTLAGISCSIAHGGLVGRAENRALVKYLQLNLRPIEELDIAGFDVIAVVDTQPGTGNNSLPAGVDVDIVIDHHFCRKETRTAELLDVRSQYGATSTIIYEYLVEAKIEIDVQLATALVYAIRSDTQDLGREAVKADIDAMLALYPIANKRMLGQIQRGALERSYFRMIVMALNNAVVFGSCVLTSLGDTENPDMIAEVADLLLRDEGIDWVICYGFYANKLLFSIRSIHPDGHADRIGKKIAARSGTAGGHKSYAGGQVPLKKDTKEYREKIEKTIRSRAVKALGLENETAAPLVTY